MKKKLLELTIEEFTSILLDHQPILTLSISTYDEKGNFINKQLTDGEDEEITVKGRYSDFYDAYRKKNSENGFKKAIKDFLDSHFDYDMQLNKLDIYNYLEYITSNFDTERVQIVLNEMDCFYLMIYLEDIDEEVQNTYINNGWDFPMRQINLSRLNKKLQGEETDSVPDLKTMREKIYPCREYMYHTAIALLKRKIQPIEDSAPNTSDIHLSDKQESRTMKVTTDALIELLDKAGVNENNSDKTKIAKLIAYITGFSENTIRQRITNQEELTSKHKDEVERINKVLSELNIGISIKYNNKR